MALKVLSFEVGQATTRVVEMDYKTKNPKIYNVFTVETPADVIQDGVLVRNEEFIGAVKNELRRRMIKTKAAVFTVSSSRIANREARIPAVKNRKQIMPIIMANASDYFPVDMNQYHLVYNILGKVAGEGEGEGEQLRLSLLAVPNDVTTSYIDFAKTMELEIKALDYVGNSVFQVVKETFPEGTKAFLKIEEHASLVTIVNDGEMVLQRQIAHGLNQAIENLMETDMFEGEELTYRGAERKFLENKIIRPHLNLDAGVSSEDANEEDLMVKVMITENLRFLVGNISRVLEYFTSRNENLSLSEVYLTGLGADFVGLSELLTNELGFDVKPYTGLDSLTVVNKETDAPEVNMREMIANIGAATNPLQLLSPELLKGEREISLVGPFVVMVAGVGIAIALLLIGAIMVKSATNKTAELQKQLDDLSYIQTVIDDYNNSEITYNEVMALDKATKNYNIELTAFMDELEEKMPADFIATSFAVSETGVTMNVTVSSKAEAAKVIEQLRTFDSISSISTGSFTESSGTESTVTVDEDGNEVVTGTEETGETTVSFSVSITYAEYGAASADEEADTAETTEATE
jgi:type IV pilus assembly protein PilM